MNIFTIFFYKTLAKYSPKRTILHHSRGIIPPNPPNMQIPPLFHKYFNPPPPRNEILDTPLQNNETSP